TPPDFGIFLQRPAKPVRRDGRRRFEMTAGVTTMDELALADWRREVFALYARVRASDDPRAGWDMWRRTRDRLFAEHPQSPLDAAGRAAVRGLPYHRYGPAAPGTAARR